MSDPFDATSALVEEAVQRLLTRRYTFTEKEALGRVWQAGYEVTIQSDARFVLAQEAIGKHPRHWRLASHTPANNRLLNDLLSGAWDGRDVERKLAELDAEDGRNYVYCPADPRLALNRQGVLEPAEREHNLALPRATREELDALGPFLLARWQEAGASPWTVRTITETLKTLGWRDAEKHNNWLLVRSWLLAWPQVRRVGLDYWILVDQVPQEAQRTRLQVLPVRTPEPVDVTVKTGAAGEEAVSPSAQTSKAGDDESRVVFSDEVTATRASWSERLRTINLLEGFLHVPASARSVYPAPAPGEGEAVIVPGMWHEDGSRLWLWLDRRRHRLYGPALAERLTWLEAGDVLWIAWEPDVIVLRLAGQDPEVHREEARLVDVEKLAALRGGLGESYRRSLQTILQEAPEGLTFAEVVKAVQERQQHEIHQGTIRALLHSGGFIQRGSHWFAAPDSDAGARQLRETMVEALVHEAPLDRELSFSAAEHRRARVKAIQWRLGEIIKSFH